MDLNANALSLLNYALWAVIGYGIAYVLLAFGLSLLGARVGQRSTWLAWLPVLNYYLMCRLAQAPLLLILPALIPVLNVLVFAFLGARMAKRVGRSAALGALFGVPVLGNIVPLMLGVGRKTEAEQGAPAPAHPPLVTALIHAGVVFTLVALPAGTWLVAKRVSRDTSPAPTVQQATASLPSRVAGTLTEFPIDSAATNKATATELQTVTFTAPKPGEKTTIGLNQSQLPPWIKAESITALAESATTASFGSATTHEPVKVVSLALRPESADELAPPTPTELAAIDPAATAKGVEVKAADNTTYRGYRVNTADSVYFALRRKDTNSLVLISAKDTAGVPVAERLAASLGNGQGLLEDDLARRGAAKLPAAPPGLKLVRLETATTAQLDAIVARMNDKKLMDTFYEEHSDRDAQAMGVVKAGLELGKLIMPRSYTAAFYDTGMTNDPEAFSASVAGFPSTSDAWTALQAVRGVFRLYAGIGQPIKIESIDVGGYDGLAVNAEGDGGSFALIALRDGSFVRAFISIKGKNAGHATPQGLRPWVESSITNR